MYTIFIVIRGKPICRIRVYIYYTDKSIQVYTDVVDGIDFFFFDRERERIAITYTRVEREVEKERERERVRE